LCRLALIVLRRRDPPQSAVSRVGLSLVGGIVAIGAGAFLAAALLADTPHTLLALVLLVVGLGGRMVMGPGRSGG